MDFVQLEIDLRRDESLEQRAYICPAGFLTIGVGHKVTDQDRIGPGSSISLERVGFMLSRDISTALGAANAIFGRELFDSLGDVRQRAICNMLFNMGEGGFRTFERMIAAIRAKDWDRAARECLDSKYARQVGKRARKVARMLRTGEDV